jgi:hypothetical protein
MLILTNIKIKDMIMTRSAAEFWWNIPITEKIENLKNREPFIVPKNVSHYEKDYKTGKWVAITWEEIFKERTNKINRNIGQKRLSETITPCLIWVFYSPSWLLGGWYTMIITINKEFYLNFRDNSQITKNNRLKVMQLFPYYLPIDEFFYDWMEKFAETYKNKTYNKGRFKKQGIAFAWCKIDECGRLLEIEINKNLIK